MGGRSGGSFFDQRPYVANRGSGGCRHTHLDRRDADFLKPTLLLAHPPRPWSAVIAAETAVADHAKPPGVTAADVAFIRTRRPFCDLDEAAFTRQNPLDRVLATETRLRRVTPGQILVRRGDYGNTAMLVLAGTVSVLHPSPRAAGTNASTIVTPPPPPSKTRWQRLADCFRVHRFAHVRDAASLRPDSAGGQRIGTTDRDVAMFLQDFDCVLSDQSAVALGPGEMFGEVAAMYRTPHAATVVATEESAVLEITWQGLRELRRDPQFDARLDEHYRTNWLPSHLRQHPLMRFLDEATLKKVAAVSTLKSFGRMRWNADYRRTQRLTPAEQIEKEPLVVRQGSFPTDLLIVRSGFGRIGVDHGVSVRTTAYLGAGHTFALPTVVRNCLHPSQPTVHQQSLRAVGMLDVIAVPIETFAAEVLPRIRRADLPESVREILPETDRRSDRRGGQDRRNDAAEGSTSDAASLRSSSLMEFVVANRLNNGPAAMVIDLDRCTGCDDCVRACAVTHGGDPRFHRDGPRHGRLQFASACMQCVDPVCMIGCPTGAITRDSDRPAGRDGVVTIDEATCVGCKTCEASCPYNNIDMAAVVDAKGNQHLDPQSGDPILKATKCDMCAGSSGGPACVESCPHDALVRIDLTHSRPLDQFLASRQ